MEWDGSWMRKEKMIQMFGKYLIVMTLCLVAIVRCTANNAKKDPPAAGDQAPMFETKDSDGNTWKLADHIANNFMVIYFFPVAMTGG
jgi:hypothetical protein